MRRRDSAVMWQGDREIFPEDIAYIRSLARRFPGLSRKELTCTLCEHLHWLTPAGQPKLTACSKLTHHWAIVAASKRRRHSQCRDSKLSVDWRIRKRRAGGARVPR